MCLIPFGLVFLRSSLQWPAVCISLAWLFGKLEKAQPSVAGGWGAGVSNADASKGSLRVWENSLPEGGLCVAPEPSDGEWVCFLLIINRCCDPESRSLGLELVLIGDARDVFKDVKIALDPCFSLLGDQITIL